MDQGFISPVIVRGRLADRPIRIDYATAARNILIYEELGHTLQSLENAGVPVILLKGAALAETVYPSIADRPMGDVDLLVHPADRDRARAALEAAGYRFVPEPPQRFSPFDTEFTGEMAFWYSDRILTELHWELTPGEWIRRLVALDMEALWEDAIPLQLNGRQTLQLSPCDTLLHLCLHLTAHGYVHGHALRDIQRLLEHYDPFPWAQFITRSRQFRLRSICYFVLDATQSEAHPGIPQDVLDSLRPPTWQRWLVRHIADPRMGLAGKLTPSRPRSYLLHLAVADRAVDVLRVISWLLFPGPRWLGERYRLHGRLRPWLACLWHPWVVLWHGVRGFWEVVTPRVLRRSLAAKRESRIRESGARSEG